jgi:hypothetical protein
LPVTPDWQTVECTLGKASWRAGVNALELRFARATPGSTSARRRPPAGGGGRLGAVSVSGS